MKKLLIATQRDTATEFGIPRKPVDLMQELFISTII
jgi:hypothetical protein